MEKTLLDTVTLSSGTLAQSPVARQPFMGKLMSVAPLAGSLWTVPSTPERREGLRACYWEGPSELPERRSSSSAPSREKYHFALQDGTWDFT